MIFVWILTSIRIIFFAKINWKDSFKGLKEHSGHVIDETRKRKEQRWERNKESEEGRERGRLGACIEEEEEQRGGKRMKQTTERERH